MTTVEVPLGLLIFGTICLGFCIGFVVGGLFTAAEKATRRRSE